MEADRGERELGLAARDGDRVAFATLVERHRRALGALCRRTLRDPLLAEDAAQEATLRAMLSLARLREPGQFGAWLCGIGLNVCRDMLRRRGADAWSWEALVGGSRVSEPADADDDPAELAAEADVAERVRLAVHTLPPGQRAAVMLFYLSGLTLAETAAQLGVSAGAVKTRLYKARARLRQNVADLWEETTMETTAVEPVEVRVADVRRTRFGEGASARVQSQVVLQEVNGARSLIIWIGEAEATAIALKLEGIAPPRPVTDQLTDDLLRSVGARLREAVITKLVDEVFYATIRVEGPGGAAMVDARPSDAINLALIAGVPIRVAGEVLAGAGIEGVPSAEVVVEHGTEIAARTVQDWQRHAPSHLPRYKTEKAD